ncbi:MAG: class A beta-lactamase-related serine hydrolase [Flavobacteriaceae bacterium]|nr:class A beta-lactamase-related serine hydrolase [Flavobacteriaceae bacterium]
MYRLLIFLLILCVSCEKKTTTTPLDNALQSQHPAIKKVMDNPEGHEIQILYSQIDTNEDGETVFTDYNFQLNNQNYFYPASTVKLPAAILALEFTDNTTFLSPEIDYIIEGDTILHNFNDDVRQIFAVSDNEAYNRLYEFLGRDFINNQLRTKKISPVRIGHRIETENAAEQERKKIKFLTKRNVSIKKDGSLESIYVEKTLKGKGFMKDSALVSEPMDFSEKNYYPLKAQHNTIKRLFFEKSFAILERFNLSPASKIYLKNVMSNPPRKLGYDKDKFNDSFGKFFIYGDSQDNIPEGMKIYNKVGYAYGTITETAYIEDTVNDVKFILSATILVNENGIFNDDEYEYEEIGIPFLAQLGREIYMHEMKRKTVN